MTTFTAKQAQSDARVPSPVAGPFTPVELFGKISVTANPVASDIYQLCYIPAGFLVTGGMCHLGFMDQHATETLDIDFGWAANGTAAAATFTDQNDEEWTDSGYAADADGFVNSGLWQGDAVTDIIAAETNIRPFPMPAGPLYFDKKTLVQAACVATAATFAAAVLWVRINGVFIKA
jgi:hypothetical protein